MAFYSQSYSSQKKNKPQQRTNVNNVSSSSYAKKSYSSSTQSLHRLGPLKYVHILDHITNVTRVEVGPQTIVCKQHEILTVGPTDMITIQPRHYVIIENPVRLNKNNEILYDKLNQAILAWGEKEIRLAENSPFPLYPGEKLIQSETKLEMIYKNEAFHLICIANFYDSLFKKERKVGEQWLVEGPQQYVPNVNVKKIKKIAATVIKQNQALRLRAIQNCIDRQGTKRIAGQEWLIRDIGAYLPGVYEQKISVISAHVLTDKKALHIRAINNFNDQFGNKRRNGEEWLITSKDTETYIPSVNEEITKYVNVTTLTSREYCVILNPYNSKLQQNEWGKKKLIIGEQSFFLYPGEKLQNGIEPVYVLNEEQGLILKCSEKFTDSLNGNNIVRNPGDTWMIRGPMEFIPPNNAIVLRINQAISLGENEGIYVRNIKTGKIRAVIGQTYLLNENEILHEKILPKDVEELLSTDKGVFVHEKHSKDLAKINKIKENMTKRDKTRVITYNVPHNHCVQVFDVATKKRRVVFGPALVLLHPGEIISPLSLSGNKPKRANVVKCLHLRLGPEFSSDVITVETSDHCRLKIALSYNWEFEVKSRNDDIENSKLFSVEDFIGDMCKLISSRVRAAVSSVPFDQFHKTSAKLIRMCVFGLDENGKVYDSFYFPNNNLKLTGIDIRSIEPEDPKTRDALQRSVQLAIEISAKTQEQQAKHKQKELQQSAKGQLEKQKLIDKAEAEIAQKKFVEIQSDTKAVQSTGKARAEAKSKAEMYKIAAKQALEEAKLEAEATKIKLEMVLEQNKSEHKSELDYLESKNKLQIEHSKTIADIEVAKFDSMCKAIGTDTLQKIAMAGPALKAKLMKGLGLDSNLLSGGNIPFVDM